jgi:hypothetical protein
MIHPHKAETGPPQYQAIPHEPVMDVLNSESEPEHARGSTVIMEAHVTHRKETMENDMPKLVSVVRPRRSSCVRRGGRAKG